ncbi:MAG: hypothetical protein DLM53_11500 [Candidatus Eremiobacter antarcticus]|nr:MAG: hypothetical protein DLM53_11500 [Candidatus Eremiobacter sp. RRmetagenome_bin22]
MYLLMFLLEPSGPEIKRLELGRPNDAVALAAKEVSQKGRLSDRHMDGVKSWRCFANFPIDVALG